MFFHPKSGFTRIITSFVIFFFVFQLVSPVLLLPRAAQAQYTDPANLSMKVSEKIDAALDKVKNAFLRQLLKGLILTVSVTLKNLLIKIAKRAAEKTVTYISTGSWGEGAMFYESDWEDFAQDIADQAIGQFLDQFNQYTGINICEPALPEIELNLKLYLQLQEPHESALNKPDCTLSKLTHNWSNFAAEVENKYKNLTDQSWGSSLGMLQESFEVSFSPDKSEIGGMLTMESKMLNDQQLAVEASVEARKEGDGYKAVTNVSGGIKTPSSLTKSHSEAELEKAKDTQSGETETAGSVITEIPEQVVLAFLNTFVSKLWTDYILKKYFQKGLVDPSKSYNPQQKVFLTKQTVEKELSLQKINFSFAQKQIDPLTDFSTCVNPRQLNSCVMDSSFAEAVREAGQDQPLTVAAAMERGYLDGGKPLIGPDDERNAYDECYEIGYCYSNLVKLRRARVVPIGWEIAARQVPKGELVTLSEAMNKFDDCGQVDLNGVTRPYSKFCHLIDPNWVLRAPQTQCKAMVAGPLLVGTGSGERAEYCADQQSCIKLGEDGTCQAWGYCAAEKNVFRFGAQECNGAFDSCRALTDRQGKEVSYLMNTVDKTNCDANNIGCLWYSASKDMNKNWQWSDLLDTRISLNNKIVDQECGPDMEGCSRFVSAEPGLGTNLAANGSFENYDGDESVLGSGNAVNVPGWDSYKLTADASAGKAALVLETADLTSPEIAVVEKSQERYFVVSAKVKKQKAGKVSVELLVPNATQFDIVGNPVLAVEGETGVSDWAEVYAFYRVRLKGFLLSTVVGVDSLQVKINNETNDNIFIDQVMLEELAEPDLDLRHAYNEYATKNPVYITKAPSYLNCYNTGRKLCVQPNGIVPLWPTVCDSDADCQSPNTCKYKQEGDYGRPVTSAYNYSKDNASSSGSLRGCDKFAALCSAEEVGCDAYKPTDGASTVYGTATYYDYCPQECAGYQAFSRSATFMEPSVFPLYFIPKTARVCDAAQAGCEEYTNLDKLAEGGEAKEYYTELKLCEKLPEAAPICKNYYTWEGSEVTGYQLQAYTLKSDEKTQAGESVGFGPAVRFPEYYSQCNEKIFNDKMNPDCRQFYNEAGKVFYRLQSKTITCSENCHPYRRTIKFTTQNECESRLGQWQAGECVFMTIPGEGRKCSLPNAGCQEYRGNLAGLEYEVENYTFSEFGAGKDALNNKLVASAAVPTTHPEFGKFLLINPGNGLGASSDPMLFTNYTTTNLGGGSYKVSFWARQSPILSNANETKFDFEVRNGEAILVAGTAIAEDQELSEEWRFYIFEVPASVLTMENAAVGITAESAFNIDNLKIVRTEDLFYFIKNTWSTPASCDYKLNDTSVKVPQAQLGCREFTDNEGSTNYLKSFSSLCPAGKVGCEAVIDTQNYIYPFEKKFTQKLTIEDLCQAFSVAWGTLNASSEFKPTGETWIEGLVCKVRAEKEGIKKTFEYDLNEPAGEAMVKTMCEMYDDFYSGINNPVWDAATKTCSFEKIKVPGDALMYLVVNDAAACPESEKGCTALGQPDLTIDKNGDYILDIVGVGQGQEKEKTPGKKKEFIKGWYNVFYKVDPEKFASDVESPLCTALEQGCEEYVNTDGGKAYFKSPGDKICEYRQGFKGSEAVYGWYKKKLNAGAKDEECAMEEYYGDGVPNAIRAIDFVDVDAPDKVLDSYMGWTAACPAGEDKCTALVDPTDISSSTRGKPHYLINDEKLNKSECNAVSRKDGCVLFNDTSQADMAGKGVLSYNAFETYINSNKASAPVTAKAGKTDVAAIALLETWTFDAGKCVDSTYCPYMVKCLQQEKTVESCVTEILSTDLQPATPMSMEFHCVDDIDKLIGKFKSANETVKKAEALNNALCSVNEVMVNDTNVIVKVIQDRDCAAWYSCKSSHWVWDAKTSKYVEICDEVGLCDKFSPGKDSLKCANYPAKEDPDNLLTVNAPFNDIVGTAEATDQNGQEILVAKNRYALREAGWFGLDYSGYSMPELSPIQFYNAFDINMDEQKKTCGGGLDGVACYFDATCELAANIAKLANSTEVVPVDCAVYQDFRLVNQSAITCQTDDECALCFDGNGNKIACKPGDKDAFCLDNNGGKIECKCLNNVCVRPFAGSAFTASPVPACRAYPEKEAPFPKAVENNRQFVGTNIMYSDKADYDDDDFACSYRKIKYGGGAIIKYFPKSASYAPSHQTGYCQADPAQDCDCDVKTKVHKWDGDGASVFKIDNKTMCNSWDCAATQDGDASPEMCMKADNAIAEYLGWQGYCMERDASLALNGKADEHPCLSWYPSYLLAGLQDINSNYQTAGFSAQAYGFDSGGPYYCTQKARWEKRTAFLAKETGWVDCDGNEKDSAILVKKEALKNTFADSTAVYDKAVKEDQGSCVGGLDNLYHYKADGTRETAGGSSCSDYYNDYFVIWDGAKKYNDDFCVIDDADPVKAYTCLRMDCEGICDDDINNYFESPQISCPAGYKAMHLYNVDHDTEHWSCDGYADKFTFEFECVPVLPDGTPVKEGWFYDPEPNGTKFSGKDANDQSVEEEEAFTCMDFYNTGDDNDNKAYSNKLYQGQPIKNTVCGDLSKETPCTDKGPYGAMNLGVTGSAVAQASKYWPNNLFVDKDPNVCPAVKKTVEAEHIGGKACLGPTTIASLFAKSYGHWRMEKGTSSEGICISNDGNVADMGCQTKNNCVFSENKKMNMACKAMPLATCTAGSPGPFAYQNTYINGGIDNFCYDDADCEVDGAHYAIDNEGFLTMQYCTNIYPYAVDPLIHLGIEACPLGGVYGEQNPPKDKDMVCKKYMYSDGTLCKNGDPEKVTEYNIGGTPPEGTYCTTELYYASDYDVGAANEQSKYMNIPDQNYNDNSYSYKQGVPIVAGIVSTGLSNAAGQPVFAAAPNKVTLGTQTGSKAEGDIVGEGGQLEVFAKFYAWAHDEQSPIRKVLVSWGDFSAATSVAGKLQNHKPRCQRFAQELLGKCMGFDNTDYAGYACAETSECAHLPNAFCMKLVQGEGEGMTLGEDRFGDTSKQTLADACIEGYFQFNHTYSCPTVVGLTDCGEDLTNSNCAVTLDDGRAACRYRLGVQVKDNWEWCNGDHGKDAKAVEKEGYWGEDGCKLGTKNALEYFDGFIYVVP